MPNLVSTDVSVPKCGPDILSFLDTPLLTAVRFDEYRPLEYPERFVDALTNPRIPPPRIRALSEDNISRAVQRSCITRWLLSNEAFPQLEGLRLNAAVISDDTSHGNGSDAEHEKT